ncbi:MAG TPA: low specificity L-threonine aldolase [Acidimicrobiales bacterium]
MSPIEDLPSPPATSFASDNAAGVLPEVMDALATANVGSALAYGTDPWTERASTVVAEVLDASGPVLFVWGGTGANVVGLQCLLRPWEAVICPAGAHIAVDECGAPERFTGCKLLTVATDDGKLRPEHVEEQLHLLGDEHHVQPSVVSITQATEVGTVYTVDEMAALAETAHRAGLLVHVDGARLANAAVALGVEPREITSAVGVDVVSLGATKAGAMYGEAVVFVHPELGADARFVRKQAAQLPSKMRFVAAQFEALLTDGLWLRAADHANRMAARLGERLADVVGVEVVRSPDANSLFVRLPSAAAVAELQTWSFVWEWEPVRHEVRLMTSFASTPDDVDAFATGVAAIAAHAG